MLEVRIKELTKDLLYPSESDEEVEYVAAPSLKKLVSRAAQPYDLEPFWRIATTAQDWFTEEEHEQVRKFLELKEALETNLSDLQGYIKGDIVRDVYVVGTNAEGTIEGIHTKIVST